MAVGTLTDKCDKAVGRVDLARVGRDSCQGLVGTSLKQGAAGCLDNFCHRPVHGFPLRGEKGSLEAARNSCTTTRSSNWSTRLPMIW